MWGVFGCGGEHNLYVASVCYFEVFPTNLVFLSLNPLKHEAEKSLTDDSYK